MKIYEDSAAPKKPIVIEFSNAEIEELLTIVKQYLTPLNSSLHDLYEKHYGVPFQ